MFPLPVHLHELASQSKVRLADSPFPLLLVAHHAEESTGLLVARRGPIEKRLVLDHGVPVDCRSNLAHETFSRFLAAGGRLTDEEANAALSRAVASGRLLGELLVAEGRLDAVELQRLLQQSLARKLFDLFTWRDGEITFESGAFATAAALKVKVPRLVLTGVQRFVPQETIDNEIGPLAGSLFALHPQSAAVAEELRPSDRERALLAALAQPKRLEELLADSGMSIAELSRSIWGLALLGVVIPADRLPSLARQAAGSLAAAFPFSDEAPAGSGAGRSPDESARLREEVAIAFARGLEQDPFELLAVSDVAEIDEIRSAYFAFAQRFAPWVFAAPDLAGALPAAEELFAAGALAFARLSAPRERETLRAARRAKAALPPAAASASRSSASFFRIETDLLDAELQYKKGRALKEAKRWGPALQQFEFAADCDPQNGAYRAEAAHCRFLQAPSSMGARALEELCEAQRIDPEAITPYLFAGEIAVQLGRFEEAETHLRSAARRLGPHDRRALDALRELAKKRKK